MLPLAFKLLCGTTAQGRESVSLDSPSYLSKEHVYNCDPNITADGGLLPTEQNPFKNRNKSLPIVSTFGPILAYPQWPDARRVCLVDIMSFEKSIEFARLVKLMSPQHVAFQGAICSYEGLSN
ncbi:hypothetical protein BC628DRAFT_52801 [Trametes gibbosa]|nr:hypothetical protein BC628DRAFT_52801 [Trametes gibbosa]